MVAAETASDEDGGWSLLGLTPEAGRRRNQVLNVASMVLGTVIEQGQQLARQFGTPARKIIGSPVRFRQRSFQFTTDQTGSRRAFSQRVLLFPSVEPMKPLPSSNLLLHHRIRRDGQQILHRAVLAHRPDERGVLPSGAPASNAFVFQACAQLMTARQNASGSFLT